MGRPRRPEIAVLTLAALALPNVAHAADDGGHAVHLTYVVPTSCPDERAFRGEVERRTDRIFWSTLATSDMRAEIRVEDAKKAYAATLSIFDGQQETRRTLEGKRCDEVAAAIAFIVALAADPTVMTRPQPENPFAESLGPPPPLPPSVLGAGTPGIPSSKVEIEETPRPGLYFGAGLGLALPLPVYSPTEARGRDLGFGLTADATLDVGATPVPLLGFTAGFGLEGDAFRFRASFGYAATPSWTASEGPSGLAPSTATFSLVRGRAEGCFPRLSPLPTLSFFPCGRFEVGSLGGNLERNAQVAGPGGSDVWVAPALSGLLLFEPLDELGLALSAGVAFPLQRIRFLETNLELYRAWPVVPQVTLELDVFP